jgi:hypothetical protein
MVAHTCFGITLPSSGSVPSVVFSEVVRMRTTSHHVTKHNTPIHNMLPTAKLRITQTALGTHPEDGNVMPTHVEATIHN